MQIQSTAGSLRNNKQLLGQNQPNEDGSLQQQLDDLSLFVVADGNDLAPMLEGRFSEFNVSQGTCEAFLNSAVHPDQMELEERVRSACEQAVTQTLARLESDDQCRHQSTTLTALGISDAEYHCGHLGDSALYHYRKVENRVVSVTQPTSPFISPSEADFLEIEICGVPSKKETTFS